MSTTNLPATFGDSLRLLRRRARLTQTELSIAVGYSPGQISMLENGQRAPNPAAVAALFIAALGLEDDPKSAAHLLALAVAEQDQHKGEKRHEADPAEGRRVTPKRSRQQTQHVVSIQEEEIGQLETIPPLPGYVVTRPRPLHQVQRWLQRERAAALVGLAGMGKSTLAAALAHEYAARHPVFWHRFEVGLNTSLEALLRSLALFILTESGEPERVAAFFPPAGTTRQPPSTIQALMLLSAGLNVLDAPLLVFDDAQLVNEDGALLAALQRLLNLAPATRLLLVTRSELNLPGLLHLTLGGLEVAEAATLVEQLAGAVPAAPLALPQDQLFAQTGGNPMLLRLAVSQWEQNGGVPTAATGDALAAYLTRAVIETLSPAAQWLLALVALCRGPVNLLDPALVAVLAAARPNHEHGATVSELQRHRLIERPAEAVLHDLVRTAARQWICARPGSEAALHRLAATWRQQQPDLLEAAYHFGCAGELAAALAALGNEATRYLNAGKGLAAATVAADLLTLAETQPASTTSAAQRATLLALRGDLLVNTPQVAEAQASYRAALALTRTRLGRAELAERLARSLLQSGEAQAALALAEEGMALLRQSITPAGVQVSLALGRVRVRALLGLGRFDDASTLCQQALTATRPGRFLPPGLTERIRAYAHLGLGYLARFRGDGATAQEHLRQAAQQAQAVGLREVEAESQAILCGALRDQGDFDGAEAAGQQALRVAQAIDNSYLAAGVLHYLSISSYYHNELALALTRSQQSIALRQQLGDVDGIVGCRLIQALVLAAQGKLAAAEGVARQSLREGEQLENPWLQGFAHYVCAIVFTFAGDLVAAATAIDQALALPAFRADLSAWPGAFYWQGVVAVAQGDLATAATIAATPIPAGAGVEIGLLHGLLQGMLAYGQGALAETQRIALENAQRAQAAGYLIYARESAQLATVVTQQPVLAELPRQVCCTYTGAVLDGPGFAI